MTQECPANVRVYGVLLRGSQVLIAAERVGEHDVLKLPAVRSKLTRRRRKRSSASSWRKDASGLSQSACCTFREPSTVTGFTGSIRPSFTRSRATASRRRRRMSRSSCASCSRTRQSRAAHGGAGNRRARSRAGRRSAARLAAGLRERRSMSQRRCGHGRVGRLLRTFAAAAIAVAAWLGVAAPEVAAQQPAVVSVDEVRMEAMVQTVPVIGRLVARRAGEVAARTAGPVAQLLVAVGDRVNEGDPIAVLDTVRLRAERNRLAALVNEAQANLERLAAQAALHRQELRRLEGLRDSAAFSQSRFEDARQEVIIAESATGTAKPRGSARRQGSRLRKSTCCGRRYRRPILA